MPRLFLAALLALLPPLAPAHGGEWRDLLGALRPPALEAIRLGEIRITREAEPGRPALLLGIDRATLALPQDGTGAPLRLPDLRLRLGKDVLAGDLTLDRSGPRPRLAGRLTADRLDLVPLLAGGGSSAAPGEETAAKADERRLLSREPLDLGALKAVDLALDLEAKQLILPGMALGATRARLALDDGRLHLAPFDAVQGKGRLTLDLLLDARSRTPRVEVALRAPALDVGRLLRELGGSDVFEGSGDLRLDLAGQGASPSALVAGLEGEASLVVGGGRLRGRLLEQVVGGVRALGELLAKPAGGDWTGVSCIAADLVLGAGRAEPRALMADTDLVTIVGEGQIDLVRERLDLMVAPRPKNATLGLSVPVRIRGTFKEPRVQLDPAAAATRLLGAAAGALLFPPAAIAALGDLGAGAAPCLAVAEGRAAQPAARSPPAAAVAPKVEDVQRAVKELRRGLRGLLGDPDGK